MVARELELRCTCSARPLLGVCGRDTKTGEPYVHVKVYKQGRIFGEIVTSSGVTRIRCRACERWYEVNMVRFPIDFKLAPLPGTISL